MARMTVSRIAVTGVSGAGKSVVGEALASRLGWPFCDGDDLHSPASVQKMVTGVPLDDADRFPWLARVGDWLSSVERGVIACSALKRSYRDQVRSRADGVWFVQLTGDPAMISRRQQSRRGHFMPTSLLASQLATFEPLAPDEQGLVLDVTPPVEELVTQIVAALGR